MYLQLKNTFQQYIDKVTSVTSELLINTEQVKHSTLDKRTIASINNFYAKHDILAVVKELDLHTEPLIFGNPDSKKTILLIDDQELVFYLYKLDFKKIFKEYSFDILSEFKIVRCCGADARLLAIKYISEHPTGIESAILDITIGPVTQLPNGRILRYDGVDIAIKLLSINPECKLGICTSHIMDDVTHINTLLTEKFYLATGKQLRDIVFTKAGDRAKHIYRILTGNTVSLTPAKGEAADAN